MKHLVEKLKREGILKTPRIIKAFTEINRADFMLEEFKGDYEQDIPMSINYGQTISQPLTVAFMLELLQPKEGDKVMDVGSGSAWTSALLAHIIGEEGKVYAVERIPQLKTFGENNLKKYGFSNIELFCGDGTHGLAEFAPFNCIQVAAAAQKKIPEVLKDQLQIGGRLVIPVGQGTQDIILLTKKTKNDFKQEKYPGFQFVPLIEED